MKKLKLMSLLAWLLILTNCQNEKKVTITVTNPTDFERSEVVELDKKQVDAFLNGRPISNLLVKEASGNDFRVTQWVEDDGDQRSGLLLFLADLKGNETKEYELVWMKNEAEQLTPESTTFSRLVPERTDDYTWENDKVAFRTFGPEAQRRVEQNEPGGTLSSGMDLWLKKVSYPIIDKWYAANLKDEGYYHTDHGEGYDPYHVGKSRGTGGIGIWDEDTLLTSKNFIAHRTIATGPLRTVFELDYAPWSEYEVIETKRITLDVGSNFSKFEVSLRSKNAPNYTIGIQTHELRGEAKLDTVAGWFRYWEPMDDAFLGEGIVIDPAVVDGSFVFESKVPDQTQIMVMTQSNQRVLTYYAGFAWTKSGQVDSVEDWDVMLEKQVKRLKGPLEVSVKYAP